MGGGGVVCFLKNKFCFFFFHFVYEMNCLTSMKEVSRNMSCFSAEQVLGCCLDFNANIGLGFDSVHISSV